MNTSDTFVLFHLDRALYGIRSAHVQHLEMVDQVTRVPNAAPAVDGVVFSRGQVFPALNLRARFGLPRQPYTPSSRLIFLKVHERVVALIVDGAREFLRIPADAIRPIQETLVGVEGNFLEGVATIGDRTILLVDVRVVLTLEECTVPEGARVRPAELT